MSDSGLIRILTVDDHALLRNGIAGLVNAEPDMKMIAEAATGVEAMKQFRQSSSGHHVDGPANAGHQRHRGHHRNSR